ncbi:hypothetical protein SLEP1_g47593 [Rubroshorea leprosula]|uniref:Uncharacterized protein n=1 Tax=Rubroshorea leprosula TaxID=152421 RepID=A0AAV5LR02_9ROSI|nr:hypothetical protein SLEP1_g47593 [Rubroshorea leprosula]
MSSIDGIFYWGLALLSVDMSAEQYMKEFLSDQLTVNQSEQVIDQLAVDQSVLVIDQLAVDQSEQVIDQLAVNQSKQGINQLAVNQLEQGIDDANKTNNRIDAWTFIARFAGAVLGGVLLSDSSKSKQLYIPAIFVGIGSIFCYSYSICYKVSLGDHKGQKHELRPLLKYLPLWAPFLIYYVVDAAGSAFFDYEAYLYIIEKFSGIIISRLIGYVITKFCSKVNQQVQQRIRLANIIFGMLVCFLLCIDTWHVQAKRKSEGSFTFTLQFILLGIMKQMVKEMLGEYFCDQVPDKSLHHLEFTFNSFVEGMGRLLAVVSILVFRNWIGETVNNSHLDKYFRTLAFMSLCALLMFVYLSNTCYLKKETKDHDDYLKKLEEGSLSPAARPDLDSSRPSVNRDYWSIVKG